MEVALCWNCGMWFEVKESELGTKSYSCPNCGACCCESCIKSMVK